MGVQLVDGALATQHVRHGLRHCNIPVPSRTGEHVP